LQGESQSDELDGWIGMRLVELEAKQASEEIRDKG
jgi:hypothetical protein